MLFEIARMSVYNTLGDKKLQQPLGLYGFSQERILEGQTLLENSRHLHGQKDNQYHAWWNLSDHLKTDREKALQTFLDHVQVAKVAFRKQPGILHELQISRINRRKTWEWTVQAHRFYTILEEHTKVMKQFGIPQEELQQAKAAIEALLIAKDQRTKKRAEAESATQARNDAIEELRAWLIEFRAVARLAFKDDPQMLEAFGMKVPS